jgi:hypothetical protein
MIQRTLGVMIILVGLSCAVLLGYLAYLDGGRLSQQFDLFPSLIFSLVVIAVGVWMLGSGAWPSWDKVFRYYFGVGAVVFGGALLLMMVLFLMVVPLADWIRVRRWPPAPASAAAAPEDQTHFGERRA